jgi:hypothetical protein
MTDSLSSRLIAKESGRSDCLYCPEEGQYKAIVILIAHPNPTTSAVSVISLHHTKLPIMEYCCHRPSHPIRDTISLTHSTRLVASTYIPEGPAYCGQPPKQNRESHSFRQWLWDCTIHYFGDAFKHGGRHASFHEQLISAYLQHPLSGHLHVIWVERSGRSSTTKGIQSFFLLQIDALGLGTIFKQVGMM